MIHVRVCVVCGRHYIVGRLFTCGSDECHEKLVDWLVEEFGEFKKVVDAESGIAYRVPMRDILERGLRYANLLNYPKWEEPPRPTTL